MFLLVISEARMITFAFQAMAAVLSTNAAIKRLNLESCKIGDTGAEARWVFLAVGPVFAWSCWGVTPLQGNAVDYV